MDSLSPKVELTNPSTAKFHKNRHSSSLQPDSPVKVKCSRSRKLSKSTSAKSLSERHSFTEGFYRSIKDIFSFSFKSLQDHSLKQSGSEYFSHSTLICVDDWQPTRNLNEEHAPADGSTDFLTNPQVQGTTRFKSFKFGCREFTKVLTVLLIVLPITVWLFYRPVIQNGTTNSNSDEPEKTSISNLIRLQPRKISVTSYTEYQSEMYNIPASVPVDVHLNLRSHERWPRHAHLEKSHQITKLSIQGSFNLEKLSFLLRHTTNLHSLVVHNSNGALCNTVYQEEKHLHLANLRNLHISVNGSCENLYKFFATLKLPDLRHFTLEKLTITNANVGFIKEILQKVRHSLRKLSFPGTNWNTSLFTNITKKFPDVNFIRLDFLSQTNSSVKYLTDSFCPTFPNLKNFTSRHGFAPWDQFPYLLQCKHLEHLRSGIAIPENRTSFNTSFMQRAFPVLQTADLFLHFSSFDDNDECSVNGLNLLRKSIKKLTLRTNCIVNSND